MLDCIIPEWTVQIFQWMLDGKLSQIDLNIAMFWLYDKGIVICNQIF